MLIGMIGLIAIALFGNILYYEFMHFRKPKKDKNLIPAYVDVTRKRKKRVYDTFNGSGGSEGKPGTGDSDDFNAR
jgi:hypothetical protein